MRTAVGEGPGSPSAWATYATVGIAGSEDIEATASMPIRRARASTPSGSVVLTSWYSSASLWPGLSGR